MLVEDLVSSLDLTFVFLFSLPPLLFLGGDYAKLFEIWIQHLGLFLLFKTFFLRALRFNLIEIPESYKFFSIVLVGSCLYGFHHIHIALNSLNLPCGKDHHLPGFGFIQLTLSW